MSVVVCFRGVRAAQSLVFCVVFCLSLFVFRGVCAAQSLVFCVVFCLSLFAFSGVCAAQSLVFCVVFGGAVYKEFSSIWRSSVYRVK